jgi:hypothetical protein
MFFSGMVTTTISPWRAASRAVIALAPVGQYPASGNAPPRWTTESLHWSGSLRLARREAPLGRSTVME